MFASINGLGYTWFLDRNMIGKHFIDFQVTTNQHTCVSKGREGGGFISIISIIGEQLEYRPFRDLRSLA
jgi:hypothetical protein